MKLINDIAATFFTQVVNFVANLLTTIIIARSLGPERQGIFALVIVFPLIITTIANMGMARAVIAFLGGQKIERQELCGTVFFLGLMINLPAVAVAAAIIILFQNQILPGVPMSMALFSLALIPFQFFFYQIFKAIFLAEQKIRLYNLTLLSKGLTLLGFVILMLPLLNLGIAGAIAAHLLATATAFALAAIMIFSKMKIKFKPSFSTTAAKSILSFSVKAHLNNIINFLQYKVDLYLLNFFLHPMAVGHYTIAVLIGEKIWIFSQTTSTVLYPKLTTLRKEEDKKGITPAVTRVIFLFTLVTGVGLLILAPWLIRFLYGVDYLPAIRPLRILLIGIVAVSVCRILISDIDARGYPMLNSYISALALVVNLGLNLILIPRHGILGAAWASSLSYSMGTFVRIIAYCRLSNNPAHSLLIPGKTEFRWAVAAVKRFF